MYRPRINLHSWSAVLLLLQEMKSWTWRTNWRNSGNSAQIISGSQSPSLRKIKEDASRMPKNRCVLFDSFTYIYSALLPQHWALYAKVDSTPTFVYIYTYIYIFFFPEGTVTNPAIWLVLYPISIFLSLPTGNGNAIVSRRVYPYFHYHFS